MKFKSIKGILRAFKAPLLVFLVFLAIYAAFKTMVPKALSLSEAQMISFDAVTVKVLRSAFIVFITIGFYNVTAATAEFAMELEDIFGIRVKQLFVPFISNVSRFVIVMLGVAATLSEWGFDVNGFVAGLGLFGLAIAMAAKSIFENFFSGSIIVTEEPFRYGDWVIAGGVEGVVEDINFRCTTVRQFDKSVVIVPNSKITNGNIQNFSRRDIRRITHNISVKYGISESGLRGTIDGIREMLRNHEGIDDEKIFVTLDSFGDTSINLLIDCFAKTSEREHYLMIREDVNYKVMGILEENGVEFAAAVKA